MKSFAAISALTVLTVVTAKPTATEREAPIKARSVPAVEVSGNAFYANGARFFIRGIDYQPGGSSENVDPLADTTICGRDIPKFKDLGVNTIRVYSVDNSKDHKECMQMLADAGIYLVADVNNPLYSINRADPHPSYNAVYLQSVFATVEEFAKYDNTLAFFSGNEVIHDEAETTLTAPYVKAVTRDIKNYMASRGLRHIPVGYSAADVADNRMQSAQYFNCGSDDARSDFFAFNDYSWCSSNFKESGWDVKVKNFTDYGIPIFLSEYGCNTNVRDFGELEALMSNEMTSVYSGGMMYEYSMEANKYGIVQIDGDNVEELKEYANFKSALSKYPAPTGDAGAAKTSHAAASCPTSDKVWMADPTKIPTMPQAAEKYMTEGAGEGPGLKGDGSQTAGDSASDGDTTGGVPSPTASGGSSNGSPNAAAGMTFGGPIEKAPLAIAGLAAMFTMFGAFLL
ncbi:glycolipid anchored surface protein [Colletotrichum graminicola]|uniref:1,3-beta-glucanosyltransferase n=1 Tax=Colletotrichum graminicola (strain M1.001 / M2 / FGSC 10212) TaxID=645133 RepID=E3QDY5_COLGM|nr:glycolipid anchored surface protein [Colletotrichum graminicola M1.001]EFQ29073.1 glycolipid anchored surface protein [Colletotrichum graminicola M1.001]WDK20179.1 glycolipid anchored surface protein [Colletotrichum graminicola]